MFDIGDVVLRYDDLFFIGVVKSKTIKVDMGESNKKCNIVDFGRGLEVVPINELKKRKDVPNYEKLVLGRLCGIWKYIARNSDGKLYIYEREPSKLEKDGVWILHRGRFECFDNLHYFFKQIKWKDEKPMSIQDFVNS